MYSKWSNVVAVLLYERVESLKKWLRPPAPRCSALDFLQRDVLVDGSFL